LKPQSGASLPSLQIEGALLPVWGKNQAILTEAFRSALTSILFYREDAGRSRLFVITSANAAEGKTTCACNLAIAMAEVKKSVLLIDADLRRPRIHSHFGLVNAHGLCNLLSSDDLTTESVDLAIQTTSVAGLDIIAAGEDSHTAANLLYSDNLSQMLTWLKDRYAMIIIDTPPMLQLNDARVVARLADSVVLVVRAEKTTRDAVIAASRKFAEDGTQVLGVLLNDWDPKRSLHGYYGYEGSTYYHQYRDYVKS
jgi:capsular exopolysaccharide synthesis family protein